MLAVGIWGARENRRWVVNIAAVFGGIHFYTQWFNILGANALSVLGGGVLILAIAMALYRYNKTAAARCDGLARTPGIAVMAAVIVSPFA